MSKMLRCLLLAYLLPSLLWSSSVYAQNLAPIHAIDGEYIREWLVLGPFFPSEMERDFLAEAGGEANIEPKEGDTVTSSDGRTLTWERYKSKGDIIDLINPIGNFVNASVYAFCILQSRTTGDAQIHLDNYGGLAVWINGERVYLLSSDRYGLDWGMFEAKLKVGANRCLIKMANRSRYWAARIRAEMLPVDRAVISGTIADEEGYPIPGATVRLEQDGEEIVKTRTDASGSYRLNIYPPRGMYDLIAEAGERSSWQSNIHLSEKERREIHFTLRRVVSIEGTLLMLDDRTPHVSVPVQAMRDGKAIATALSDEGGRYRLINLKPGRYQVRCHILNGYVYYEEAGDGRKWDYQKVRRITSKQGNEMSSSSATSIGFSSLGDFVEVEGGKTVSNIDFRFAHFKKGTWRNYNTFDGLASGAVNAILRDPNGVMWFGTGGGVSRYDGREFANLTSEDGLVHNIVLSIHREPIGAMLFGTEGGVSRYDGKEFVNFTIEDGLLPGDSVCAIHREPDGTMWFATEGGGVSRYDGKEFVNFITKDGLADNSVLAIHRDPDGVMWFGTEAGGVSQYDKKAFANFTTKDGLADNDVRAIHRDPDGVMWFGTLGGVSCYDGTAWSSLDMRDGLVGNSVLSIHQDTDGSLWFATNGGVTRYRRDATPPQIQIVSVTADETYRNLSSIPAFATGTRITFEYGTIDFKTIPEKRQYRCRVYETQDSRPKTQDEELKTRDSLESGVLSPGSGEAYFPPTKHTTFDWIPRKPGAYVFEVQAIDRDLNYSEPANLTLKIVPPFYMRASFLVPTMGSAAVLILITIVSATAYFRHRRQVRAYQQAAVKELRDAHEMQIALLPEAAPPVEGMEIAGRSVPANTVGGDFFDYLELADGRVGIAIADVSGKGLRAAMNAVLADGMMHEVATIEASCSSILSRLNAHLYPLMEKQMFTALSFAILGQDAIVVQWSNAGQPLPLIKRSDGASEADGEGELPLGMMPDVAYQHWELRLQPGDLAIFYTDGVIEAENESEEMYGTERLVSLVAGMDSGASAEDAIEAILQDVARFVGDAEQYDDMTVVVVKKGS